MNYPFVVIPEVEGTGWTIQFPDLPGATGFVTDLKDVPHEVETVQKFWIDCIEDDGREAPTPSFDWNPIDRQPEDFTVEKVYTTQEVADLLNLSTRRVNAISNSRGLGRLLGRVKMFTEKEIDNMKIRTTGRPKVS